MSLPTETMEILQALIPELTESEDERVRKELIEQVGYIIPNKEECDDEGDILPTYHERIERYRVWLEKRKEQKPAECGASNDESEYDRGYREGHKFGLRQTQEYMLPGGKTFSGLIPCWVNAPSTLQPAHKYHGKNVVIMHENNGGFRCCCIDDEKATTFHLPENTLFVEGWRKKPIEWSEEEKKFIKHCADLLDAQGEPMCALRLKSLRPSWKPSEEQMEALMLAIEGQCPPPTSYMSRRLEDLYEGLVNTYNIECKLR